MAEMISTMNPNVTFIRLRNNKKSDVQILVNPQHICSIHIAKGNAEWLTLTLITGETLYVEYSLNELLSILRFG